jgi:cation:H+ antiporter
VEVLILVGALLLIVLASELFTNAVEWAGSLLHVGSGATGSILAAVGTALPETVVVVVALAGGGGAAQRVAVGAVLGSSFLLLTLGAGITGFAVLTRKRRRQLVAERAQVRRDLNVFLTAFPCAIAATVLTRPERIVVGVLLLAIYAAYARATLRAGGPRDEMPEPLHLLRLTRGWGRARRSRAKRSEAEARSALPRRGAVGLQLAAGVVLLVVGSELFVQALEGAAQSFGIDSLVLALIVVPFATELPETMNSVLWVRSGDDTLAFGNVAGAAAFQACILGFLGLSFTGWDLGAAGLISAGCTFVTGLFLLAVLRGGRVHGALLAGAALPWVGYAVAELLTRGRLGG